MSTLSQFELLGFNNQELTELVEKLGEPRFRARQLFEALYRQRLATLEGISTLSKSLRSRLLAQGYCTGLPAIDKRFVSLDGTVRYLVRFSDGQTVETVWMPDGDGVEETEELLSGARPNPRCPISREKIPGIRRVNARPSACHLSPAAP